jgi:tetraacyldisaccharide 4'-kinase
LNHWLNRIWYGGQPPPLLLRWLSRLFGALVARRQQAYARGHSQRERLPVPVIVVGNVTVGGTGKTPLVIWLIRELQNRGVMVGAVLRGYGAIAAHSRLVGPGSTADEVGDEALLIAGQTGCVVAVGADRVRAAKLLIDAGARAIVADDGLQHLRLGRDLEIGVIDGERGFGNGWLLPAGPLREPVTRLESVALVVQNGGDALRRAGALRMRLSGSVLRAVSDDSVSLPLDRLAGRRVHAVAGIGNPQRFFASLRAAGCQVTEHAFPDHHRLRPRDLEFADDHPVLMTEKDAVKCRGIATARHWYLPVRAEFSAADANLLLRRVFMDARLLEILVCPLCKGPLQYEKAGGELICRAERLAFPIRDGVPVMLEEEARALASDDPLLTRATQPPGL